MSTNRHSRIITVLVGEQRPLSIISLTDKVNKRYLKDYSPSLVGGDVKTLIAKNLVKIDEEKCFSLTGLGIVCSEAHEEEARLNDRSREGQPVQV